MGVGGGVGGGRRLITAVLAVPGVLREDLWTAARRPQSSVVPLGWLARLSLLLLAAVYAALVLGYLHGTGQPSVILTVIEAAVVVLAVFRPVLAWWIVTIAMLAGVSVVGGPYPWSHSVIATQAWVVLLLALRFRPRVVLEALVIALLAGLASAGFQIHTNSTQAGWIVAPFYTDLGQVVLVWGLAATAGGVRRARRVAGTRLAAQERIVADERARRAALEERTRIARELHDVVAHHLSVISIQAQVTPHLVTDPPEELKRNSADIRGNAVEALTELRRILGVLRLEDTTARRARHLPQPTLAQADELIDNVRRAGVTVDAETIGEPRPLAPGVDLSAFRLIQEALSNAMRHAPGAAIRVAITYHRASLTIRVTNTAPERPTPPSSGAGHGLLGMRERVGMLGGELVTVPTPDGGYDVSAILPAPTLTPPAEQASPSADHPNPSAEHAEESP